MLSNKPLLHSLLKFATVDEDNNVLTKNYALNNRHLDFTYSFHEPAPPSINFT